MGPTKRAAENIGIENPLCLWFQKSANAPPITDTGLDPKKPCKNLNTNTLCRSCATATGI